MDGQSNVVSVVRQCMLTDGTNCPAARPSPGGGRAKGKRQHATPETMTDRQDRGVALCDDPGLALLRGMVSAERQRVNNDLMCLSSGMAGTLLSAQSRIGAVAARARAKHAAATDAAVRP